MDKSSLLFSYSDFLKQRQKVQIDGKDSDSKINTLEGFKDIHPNLEFLEIGNTLIKDFSPLSGIKSLKNFMPYANKNMFNLDGLKDLNLNLLSIHECPNFKGLGNVDITVKEFRIGYSKDFKVDFKGVKGLEIVHIGNINYIKDLSFLEHSDIKEVQIGSVEQMDSLFGIQYKPNVLLKFWNSGAENHDFMYHKMFYEGKKGEPIKDYWKEIVDYWKNQYGEDYKNIDEKDFKEVFIEGIKVPLSEVNRLFTKGEQNMFKSMTTINRFSL